MLYQNSLVALPYRPALLCRFQARLTNKISGVVLNSSLNEGWRQNFKEEDKGNDGKGDFGLPGQKFAITHNISPDSFGKDSSVLISTVFLRLIIDRILLRKKVRRLFGHLPLGLPHVVLIWFHWFAIIIVWLTIFEFTPKWYPLKNHHTITSMPFLLLRLFYVPSQKCLLLFHALDFLLWEGRTAQIETSEKNFFFNGVGGSCVLELAVYIAVEGQCLLIRVHK